MTIAATSLAAALWDKYGRIDAIRRSSKKDAQQMLMCFCIDNVLSRWTPRYLTDVLKGTLFPPMFAHSRGNVMAHYRMVTGQRHCRHYRIGLYGDTEWWILLCASLGFLPSSVNVFRVFFFSR